MKEVTYEDWQENPTPREMWVWDDYEEDKKKLKVIHISKGTYPVVSITLDGRQVEQFKHCAEIEKQRRMTNKELARWLREKPTREYKDKYGDFVYGERAYRAAEQDEEVVDSTLIREDDGEWQEPTLVDVEE